MKRRRLIFYAVAVMAVASFALCTYGGVNALTLANRAAWFKDSPNGYAATINARCESEMINLTVASVLVGVALSIAAWLMLRAIRRLAATLPVEAGPRAGNASGSRVGALTQHGARSERRPVGLLIVRGLAVACFSLSVRFGIRGGRAADVALVLAPIGVVLAVASTFMRGARRSPVVTKDLTATHSDSPDQL